MIDIIGLEDRYAVTETGKVWSKSKTWLTGNGGRRSHAGMYLKPYRTGKNGEQYLVVDLNDKPHSVHRLVAQAYLPNPENLPNVNHKNGNRLDNTVENLEWCTQKENMQHAQRMGLQHYLYGEKSPVHKLSDIQVSEIRAKKAAGATLKELSAEYKSSISNMSYICRRETRVNG